jgi:hypothetical protein
MPHVSDVKAGGRFVRREVEVILDPADVGATAHAADIGLIGSPGSRHVPKSWVI